MDMYFKITTDEESLPSSFTLEYSDAESLPDQFRNTYTKYNYPYSSAVPQIKYGDRYVGILTDLEQFPDKTVFLDMETGDIAAIPNSLLQDTSTNVEASANVFHTGQYSLVGRVNKNNMQFGIGNSSDKGYELATNSINACNDNILVIKDYFQGFVAQNGHDRDMPTGMDNQGNWDSSIDATDNLISYISETTGITINRQNELSCSCGDAVAMKSYANNEENRGILCIVGASASPGTMYTPDFALPSVNHPVTGKPLKDNPNRAFLTDEEYKKIAGETVFVVESTNGEYYTYVNKLCDNDVNVYLFEVIDSESVPSGSAHAQGPNIAFNYDIFDVMNGDKEKLQEMFDAGFPIKKRITNENGENEWVDASFNEVYRDIFLSNLSDKELKSKLRTVEENKLIDFMDANPNKEVLVMLSSKDDDILFNYVDIVSTASSIINAVNSTAMNEGINDQFFDETTASFPASLNNANRALFAITSNLLDTTAGDAHVVEQMLNDFIMLDNDLAKNAETELLNSFLHGAYTNQTVSIDQENLSIVNNNYIFEPCKAGQVGKISMYDIDSLLNGEDSSIFAALDNEYNDACRLQEKINEMIALPATVVKGKAWNAEMKRLELLSDCCEVRKQATDILKNAYHESLLTVRNYYDETAALLAGSNIVLGEVLDDGDIPIYEENNAILRQQITDLKAEKAAQEEIVAAGPEAVYSTSTDKNGNVCEVFDHWDWSKVEEAQDKIADIEIQISQKEEEVAYNTTYINQLKGLANVLNDANKIVDDAVMEVNSTYGKTVENIQKMSPNLLILSVSTTN